MIHCGEFCKTIMEFFIGKNGGCDVNVCKAMNECKKPYYCKIRKIYIIVF